MEEARRVRIERLRWQCRRALLELDIVFQRFWLATGDDIDDVTLDGLEHLLALEDHDLWERVNGRQAADNEQMQQILKRLTASATREH